MLRKPDESNQVMTTPVRIAAFDRARTFIILLVLLHHSVLNYTWFGHGDPKRWLGFDLVVLFNDSFFMAFMFLVSGLFVRDSLVRKGPAIFLRDRAWRLGVPYLISVFVLIPVAYYPSFLRYHLPGTTDFSFAHFWWRTVTVGPWPSGPAWFLWVLLALDAIAAAVWVFTPRFIPALGQFIFALRDRPVKAFVLFLIFSVATYLPMHLAFGDVSWLELGRFPLPIQSSRILLYAGYFFVGIGVGAVDLRTGLLAENGEPAKTLAGLARLCVCVLRLDPCSRLCPPQLGDEFRFPAAVMESRVRPRLCDVQRRNGLYGVGHFSALCAIALEPARRDAAFGLRHLPRALHFHHVAAIRRL